MDIDGARAYLKTVMSDRFTDRTFEHYIDHALAGDFSVEIANSIKGLEEEVMALTAENTRIFAMVDAREQTIAELTALCDGYRGEGERLTNRLAEYKRGAQKYLRRESDLKSARDRAEKTVTELKARCKGYAVLLDGIAAELNTVPVDENDTDPAKSTLFMIGVHIATFGDRPESVLDDSDDISRLAARVDELEGLAYSNGELYNKEYLRREAAESALTRARAEGMEAGAVIAERYLLTMGHVTMAGYTAAAIKEAAKGEQ